MQNARHRFLVTVLVLGCFLVSGMSMTKANARALDSTSRISAADITLASDSEGMGIVRLGSYRDFGKGPVGH